MNIGIVGNGVVGHHLQQLFRRGHHGIAVFDKYDPECSAITDKAALNLCDIAFIAVPTPARADGSCDTSAVEEVVDWITAPICIKSTVPPGTVDRLTAVTDKQIAFSPEYVGETPFHPSALCQLPDLVAVGGTRAVCDLVVSAYRTVLGPEPRYFITNAVTAELSKYMENCFFATKVAFVAQFFLLASHFGADFTEMREIWTADTRVGRSHSTIIERPGFGGKCLPKDLTAIISEVQTTGGDARLLMAVHEFNKCLAALGK